MILEDFNLKADNKWVYKIVHSSDALDKIMEDIRAEIPELIKASGGTANVRSSMATYICNPVPFKTYSSQTSKLIRILKRHLLETKEFAAFERIANSLRSKVRQTIKKLNISENFEDLLGCSSDELIQHLETQFTDDMTWDNYGSKGWHIDHIKPLCSFILTDSDQVREATHFTNLRPLWAKANLAKGKEDRKLSVRKKSNHHVLKAVK